MSRTPPQRLAVGDPGFKSIGPRSRIFLDGAELSRCTAYDTAAGTVRVQAVDGAGRPIRHCGRVVEKLLSGRVEVQWR